MLRTFKMPLVYLSFLKYPLENEVMWSQGDGGQQIALTHSECATGFMLAGSIPNLFQQVVQITNLSYLKSICLSLEY